MYYNKEDVCYYGTISYLLSGILYFYYLNTIKKCGCVNSTYMDDVKKYFIMTIFIYIINCIHFDNNTIILIFSILALLCHLNFIFSVRILVNDIYMKNCECADTTLTSIISIINYINIFIYIHFVAMCILLSFSILKIYYINKKSSEEYEYFNNNINMNNNDINMNNNELIIDNICDNINTNKRIDNNNKVIFFNIIEKMKEKKLGGNNIANLAKNLAEKNNTNNLNKLYNKLI